MRFICRLADDAPPFHDDLYLCYPERAARGARVLSDDTKDVYRADMLTKLCQLASKRAVLPLLTHAFRLLAPLLEVYRVSHLATFVLFIYNC